MNMSTVYCGTCGASLSETAKFCRACGNAQATPYQAPQAPAPEPAPPPLQANPVAVAARQSPSASDVLVGLLAIVGGVAMCFITLFATIYQPLHHDFSVNYGESVRLGDVVAFASGLVAIAIGRFFVTARPGNRKSRGTWLVVAGTPTLIVALLWSFPEAFNLSLFPLPFYFAFVYFPDLGTVHIGSGYVPLPLVIACAMVVAAGCLIVSQSSGRTVPPPPLEDPLRPRA